MSVKQSQQIAEYNNKLKQVERERDDAVSIQRRAVESLKFQEKFNHQLTTKDVESQVSIRQLSSQLGKKSG